MILALSMLKVNLPCTRIINFIKKFEKKINLVKFFLFKTTQFSFKIMMKSVLILVIQKCVKIIISGTWRGLMLRSPFRSWKIVLHLRYSSHDVKRIWFSPFKWLPFQMHLDVWFRSWLFEIQSSFFFLTRELSPFGFLSS